MPLPLSRLFKGFRRKQIIPNASYLNPLQIKKIIFTSDKKPAFDQFFYFSIRSVDKKRSRIGAGI
ncbi:hypothetical protein CWC46_18720 [Prodigiosinella confusarubida]|uniref:Uncharacterized protein n=1 Tax=Serratia sp. (strain ATCC 39006) TaxID=104623 RepID=A0A2I5TN36_SERS3|nr:hypothetical protein CWC46_18720 [Serratia sp. ATCC 39006]AUH05979.1 hypothetical protein Ser39006_018720 [Serratia sp. ATCC 39006]